MELFQLVTGMLGLTAPWRVSHVTVAGAGERLDITVNYGSDGTMVCPRCGARGEDRRAEDETWRHPDFCRYVTYLHTRVPHLTCCGRRIGAERPWARPGSRFVKIDTAALGA